MVTRLLKQAFSKALFIVPILIISPLCISSYVYADGDGDDFKIEGAKWSNEKNRLEVKGKGQDNRTVTVMNAETASILGTDNVDDDEWRVRNYSPSSIPCRVRATQSGGGSDEKKC